jgi:hypothetical protein
MIHYHGGPVTPLSAALDLWTRRHAFVSFARPDQIGLAAEVAQTFALDNGAFTLWGKQPPQRVDVAQYAAWVNEWRQHPGFDWALIPDSIDGDEAENDRLIAEYRAAGGDLSQDVPVWHLHESLGRLRYLACAYPRVALGSSGEFHTPGTTAWWNRMHDAMGVVCDDRGRPRTKLHGLRMLDPTIFSQLPLASADSTNVAQNIGIDDKWRTGRYQPPTPAARAIVMAARIEHHASAARYTGTGGNEKNHDLFG